MFSLALIFLLAFQIPVSIEPRARLAPPTVSDAPRADLRIDVPLVLIPVNVTNALGIPIRDLNRGQFRVLEDGVEQTIANFSNEDAALSIGLLIDSSGSMRNKMRKSLLAVSAFFQTSNPDDEFFLIEFNDRPKLSIPFTRNLADIENRLPQIKPGGRTALFDAIYLALSEMKRARNSRKVILILSDGGDNRSRYTESQINSLASESDAQIYSMGIYEPDDVIIRTPEERYGPLLLRQLAEQTGGKHFAVKKVDELPGVCSRISAEIRNQYLLGYSPANAERDGKYRNVKVLVTPSEKAPGLRVRHRLGYYAPGR